MMYRKDLSRLATEVSIKSGFDFDSVYHFLFKVLKETDYTMKMVRESIKVGKGDIYISSSIRLFTIPWEHYNKIYNDNLHVGNLDEPDYEDAILERQEKYEA